MSDQSTFARALHIMARAPSLLAAGALFMLMLITFSDVVLRSTFNNPVEAATELTRILMAVIVFSSLPIVSARGEHIVVDLFDFAYSPGLAKVRDAVVDMASGILLIWPTQRCFILAERAREYGDVTEYLNIPQFYVAMFVTVATGITSLVLILRGILRLIKR